MYRDERETEETERASGGERIKRRKRGGEERRGGEGRYHMSKVGSAAGQRLVRLVRKPS
jgi:hypothetical protein